MKSFAITLACAAALALPAAAQTTDGTAEDTAAPQASEDTNPDAAQSPEAESGAATGDSEAAAPQQDENPLGRPYTREVSGDWELRCVRTETPANDPCQLYQLLTDGSGNAVSEISVFRLPEGGDVVAGATVIVPLETLLTAQLTVAVDGNNPKRYPFSFCNQVGCYARLGLTQADVNAYKRGAKAQVQIRPFAAPDQTVTVEMSLSGFTAGYDKITIVQNQ